VDTSWVRPAAWGLAARLLARPVLLVFLNPSRLTPLLRPSAVQGRAWPAYDAHQNNFIPFATSKHQFLALLSFVRSFSALWRYALALRSEMSSRDSTAVALGDLVGDSAEVMLMASRYGTGPHRAMHVANALAALYYARALLLHKPHDQQFARLLQQCAVASIPPLWFFFFCRMRSWLRWGSAASLVAILGFVLPQLWEFFQRRPDERRETSEVERADRKLNRTLAGLALFFFVFKAHALTRVVFRA
jgi:hypothetical protein